MKTKSEVKHTPTPWKCDDVYSMKFRAGDTYIGEVDNVCLSPAEKSANAAFIVQAVNSHDALVQIATAYRNLLRSSASTEDSVRTYHHIEAVLKQVEGK